MTTPPPFTRQLPANYESSSDPFVLFHPPEPTATSVEWRMLDGKWQKAEGPDMARREGMVTTVRGRNLGANDRMNREEGRQYMWCPMADYVAAMGQPDTTPDTTPDTAPLLARIASLEAEIQALRGGLLIVHGEVSRLVGVV